MAKLFFDTETTGLVQKRLPATDEGQPNLVQLAAILYDDDWNEVNSLNCIVYPRAWEVPEAASNVHKITTEKASKYGININAAYNAFYDMVEIADKVVAHNADFDVTVMRRASVVCGDGSDPFEGKQVMCTMKAATNVVQVLHARPRHAKDWKFPKLEECYRHFYNEELEGAHDALVDVRACVRVYKTLCEHYKMEA